MSNEYNPYKHYWSTMKDFVDTLFLHDPSSLCYKYSFVTLHSIVYKYVKEKYAHKFHSDLLDLLKRRVAGLNANIEAGESFPNCKFLAQRSIGCKCSQQVKDLNFFRAFHKTLLLFFHNVKFIVGVCDYLDRGYLKALQKDLQSELMKLFQTEVCEKHMDRIIAIGNSEHLDICQDIKCSVFDHLYRVNEEYAQKDRGLFAKHLKEEEKIRYFFDFVSIIERG